MKVAELKEGPPGYGHIVRIRKVGRFADEKEAEQFVKSLRGESRRGSTVLETPPIMTWDLAYWDPDLWKHDGKVLRRIRRDPSVDVEVHSFHDITYFPKNK